ncbi:uncharacterized protein LOC126262313 [Schistocerca nitens]|uniref:uncharacterized protein LOC126262313 n=1 Tax=Schistocerca nitens TaxID=7011 RepID=UPI002117DC18|nr:uncharacterized protein LOC126262313 [Schistocerca nitens]
MDTPGKVTRPVESRLHARKENDVTSKTTSVYDDIPENEISSREATRVGQLPAQVHCSDYLQQTLSDLMQLNPDDFVTHDQLRQFSHHVPQDTNSETVEYVVSASDNVESNLRETADASYSNSNSQPADITAKNDDASEVYYSHIYNCIVSDSYPEDYSESYYTALKKRAGNYCVINGTLYYNHKQPREVITKKHHQQKILQNAHIESETGIHLGAKRMHETLNKTYFWRGMYVDIITFVRGCHICSESFCGSHLQSSAQRKLDKTHENDNEDDLFANNENSLDTDLQIRNRVWQKVLVKVCGPYPKTADHNEYLITIVDPVSMWICVKPTTSERNIKTVATFIIKIFCLLGFAECCFIGFTTQELEKVQQHYKGGMFESELTSCMFGNKTTKRAEMEQHGADECSWSTNLLNDFVNCYPSDWDRKIQSFLLTYHVSFGCDSLSPFYKLHGRNPKYILEENKENTTKDSLVNKVSAVCSIAKGKSQNFVLQQIHQKNDIERAQQSETQMREDCPLFHRKFRRKNSAEGHQDNAGSGVQTSSAPGTERRAHLVNRNQLQKVVKFSQPSEIRASTIACVKKLLECAREKQRKRGRYHKYSPEIREQIAQYVTEKGASEAARYFSKKLGRVVSESTIRNIFKIHNSYTPELKQEIGKYAVIYGVRAASDHFTQKLGRATRLGIVHKFKRLYLSQIPTQLKKKINKKRSNASRKRHYSDELKEEIGNYAFKYTVGAAIQHYSRKFGHPITETVVRRFRKMYLQKTFEKQSQWKQKQEQLAVQQKGKQLQHERAQQQIHLNIQENTFKHQMEQTFPQNHIHESCVQSADTVSAMQTINILQSSMSVLNDPQFSDSPNTIFPSPAAVSSNCASFNQHTSSVLDIQPYTQCSGSVISSSLVFPSQFNHIVDSTPVSNDPNISVQEYQHNELYSYYNEHSQRGDINSISGNNYISSLQLPPLSHFSDAELANKTISALDGMPAHPRKQQSFHLSNSSSHGTDRLVSQIHSVLSQTGDVLFQQEGIPQLTETNATIQLNSDQAGGGNTNDTIPTTKYSGDSCRLHTSPSCFSVSHVCTKASTEYSVNTLFDDQNNTFLLPPRGDCNILTYNKCNEVKALNVPYPSGPATVHEANSTNSSTFLLNKDAKSPVPASDVTNSHLYSVQCTPDTLQPLEPEATNVLQIHETTATLNSSPPLSTLSSQNSEQQSPLSFVISSTNAPVTQKTLKTSITPASSVICEVIKNIKPVTSDPSVLPADVPQKPATPLSSSLFKEKQIDTSATMYPSCSVSVLKETMSSSTSHPFLVQSPVNRAAPLYTVATTSSRTTTKSVACAYAITLAQEEKKKIKVPLWYFSQSQLTEPPPLVAITQSKLSLGQSPSHVTVFPVTSVTETLCTVDSRLKIPPLAVLSHPTPSQLSESTPLQNSVITGHSHSSEKQSPVYQLDSAHTLYQHEKVKTLKPLISSEETLDQSTDNQSKLSDRDSSVYPIDKAVMSSVSSGSNTDHAKNKFNSMQKKISPSAGSSSSLHSVNNLIIMQNHGTVSQSLSSLVASHQMTLIPEGAITHAGTAQTKPNFVENIHHSTSVSSSVQNTNMLAAKLNLLGSACSVAHIGHPKTGSSPKIPELANSPVTDTRPSAATVSVQALTAVSDFKHTVTTASTNSHVIVMSSQAAAVCRPKVSTVLSSTSVDTAIPVNSLPDLTSINVQSSTEEIPIIVEYHNEEKQGMESRSEVPTDSKHLTTCRSKGEVHNPVVTLPAIHNLNYITVASSNTPVMSHKLTVPCNNTGSNCTSTQDSCITSNSLTTPKPGNSSPCYTGSISSSNTSWNGVTRILSTNNLSDNAIISSSNAPATATAVSPSLLNKNCLASKSTSLDYLAEVSLTNTSASTAATSAALHIFLDNLPEISSSRTIVKHSNPISNSKNSSTFTDTTFSYKSKGSLSCTAASYTDTTYSRKNLSSTNATPLSANNSLKSTVRVSSSKDLSTGLEAPDITKGDDKPNPVATKKSQKKVLSRSFKGCKRGNYCVYSPELRAEMGRYAAEHGSQQACLYFKHVLGVEIPSSTMRTLRDKYLLKREHCTFDQKVLNKEVTSLGYGQRGRPMRLGKYDEEVRRCIQEIVKTGEPVSSYLVIETARQVLMQYDPSLLEENGGNIKLNVSWAKSFLRRTGLRNNS